MFTVHHFAEGDRVELHPATDTWMRGDRYGTVRSIGRNWLHVHMDRSNKVLVVNPLNIDKILYPRAAV